jgi:hypothetical protein
MVPGKTNDKVRKHTALCRMSPARSECGVSGGYLDGEMTQIPGDRRILGLSEEIAHCASLVPAPVECVDSRDKVTEWHSEARDRGVPQPDGSGREDGLSPGTADVGHRGPGRIDD